MLLSKVDVENPAPGHVQVFLVEAEFSFDVRQVSCLVLTHTRNPIALE